MAVSPVPDLYGLCLASQLDLRRGRLLMQVVPDDNAGRIAAATRAGLKAGPVCLGPRAHNLSNVMAAPFGYMLVLSAPVATA